MPHKRKRTEGRHITPHPSGEPRMDETRGQRSALPNVDDSDDNDVSAEAITYLRNVRSEASAIPDLLVAPIAVGETSSYEANRGHWTAQYLDGIYCAIPDAALEAGIHEHFGFVYGARKPRFVHPEQVYHARLLQIYKEQRRTLRILPTSSMRSNLVKCPTEIDQNKDTQAQINTRPQNVFATPPKYAQIASMSQDTVLWLLGNLPAMIERSKWSIAPSASGLTSDSHAGSEGGNLGAWIWGLLVRLDDVGMLSSEEVSIVRELGKRAGCLLLGTDFEQAAGLVNYHSLPDADEQVREKTHELGRTQSFQAKRHAALLRRNSSSDLSTPDAEGNTQDINTLLPATSSPLESSCTNDLGLCTTQEVMKATLDMILTVVGECYGQRDLLVARSASWRNAAMQN